MINLIRAIRDYLKLNKHQKKSSKQHLQHYQLKELKKLIDYAKEHSPYYQETLKNLPLETLDDYRSFPIINKVIMMENFSELNTENIQREDAMQFAVEKEKNKDYLGYYQNQFVLGLSSGTSGNKGLFITPKSLTKRLPAVFLARSGLSLRDLPYRILFLLRVFSQGFDDINAPFIKLNYLSTMTPPQTIIDTLNKNNTNILMAPPSLLNQLVPHVKDITVNLKKIITYAEVLTFEDKEKFKRLFKTNVIEIYQASEGQIASPCKEGNLHINEDLVYIELFDKNDQRIEKPHIIGHKMILTNLINRSQPLIRYEMNDMVVLDEPCKCGSSFRTIKKILGRDDDILYFYDHNNKVQVVYPDLFARWIITESDQIREFQVTQDTIGELRIIIDTLNDYNSDQLKARVLNELSHFNLSAKVSIKKAPIPLPKDKNKFKRFIQNSEV